MKLALISFTERGSRLCGQIEQALCGAGYLCAAYANHKYADKYNLQELNTTLTEWTKEKFANMDGMLFIGATGIAVRSIAPFLQDKKTDPAVVVMDEKGVFVISLLSGHLGGANELAGVLANLTGAIPVITTATDINGRFAVDIFAKRNQLYIENMVFAKYISADVLDEKSIGLFCDNPIVGELPEEIILWEKESVFEGVNGIVISPYLDKQPFKQTLHLIPRVVTVGIGCRKGKSAQEIAQAVLSSLEEIQISIHSLEKIASIDLKIKEDGILTFAQEQKLPFITFSAEELGQAEGEFEESEFVASVTGVPNVCERSACLGSENGTIIMKKRAGNGITIALAIREWSVDFE